MNAQLIEADNRLADVFSHFYCIRPGQETTTWKQLLPNYEMLAILNFGPAEPISIGDHSYSIQGSAIIGPLQKLLRYQVRPDTDLIVVSFTLNGFYRLFKKSMQTLRDKTVYDPDVLLNQSCFDDLWQQLAPMRTLEDRLQRISEYILQYVMPVNETMHPLLDTIPHFRHTLVDPVKEVAQTRHLSQRVIQQRFQTQLGYSAKELTRFLRFKKVMNYLIEQAPASPVWADLVFAYGYHDQSHLIKDFQYFTGQTPRAFVSQLDANTCISQSGKYY